MINICLTAVQKDAFCLSFFLGGGGGGGYSFSDIRLAKQFTATCRTGSGWPTPFPLSPFSSHLADSILSQWLT